MKNYDRINNFRCWHIGILGVSTTTLSVILTYLARENGRLIRETLNEIKNLSIEMKDLIVETRNIVVEIKKPYCGRKQSN